MGATGLLDRKSQAELQQGTFSETLASAKSSEKLLASDPQSLQWGDTFLSLCYAYIRTEKLDSSLLSDLQYFRKLDGHSFIN